LGIERRACKPKSGIYPCAVAGRQSARKRSGEGPKRFQEITRLGGSWPFDRAKGVLRTCNRGAVTTPADIDRTIMGVTILACGDGNAALQAE
jgi:hypothetical protein